MRTRVSPLVVGLGFVCASPFTANAIDWVRITLPPDAGVVPQRAGQLLARQITKRCDARATFAGEATSRIELAIEPGIGPEGYQIADGQNGLIRIIGNDERGLVYGVGKFLRTSRYDRDGFTPGSWRGISVPVCPVRGMYFATHFANYFEAAPIADVQEYVDELALWGINSLEVTFPRWHFEGFGDPAAQRSLALLTRIMRTAKSAGMKVKLGVAATDGFKSTPKELLGMPVPDPLSRRGNFGVNLCPSNLKAHELLLADWSRLMDQFADIGLDQIGFCPYDEGGCGCENCWPWGARGYPALCRDLSRITRAKYPDVKVILSTWMFDTPPAGEWEGLAAFLAKDKSWIDYIQADSHEGFPRYPLEKGVPGGLPLLNFPEISMWGQNPWGGYGANPFPSRLQRLWNQTEKKLAGGFPYSEGIYEDMNKVICSQLYWSPDRPTSDIVKEYVAFEYSPDVVDEVLKAVSLLEKNHLRNQIGPSAEEAFRTLQQTERKLTPQARSAWRWRILYLRALIDREMSNTNGRLEGNTLKKAFDELTAIYHAENVHSMPLHPPTIP